MGYAQNLENMGVRAGARRSASRFGLGNTCQPVRLLKNVDYLIDNTYSRILSDLRKIVNHKTLLVKPFSGE
jgi:hypothetical protein